jgi:butyryl-CoA dehydrogenase
MQGGAALKDLFARMGETIAGTQASPELGPFAAALAAAIADSGATALLLVEAMPRDPERALANATLFLDALGHVVVAWRWLAQAQAALAKLAGADPATQDFCRGKLAACRYFFRYELPKTRPAFELLRSLDDTAIAIPDAGF